MNLLTATQRERARLVGACGALLLLVPAAAIAEPADDGYCDFVEGAAAATAVVLSAPQLIGQVGYIEQPSFGDAIGVQATTLRVRAGVRYSLSGLYAGVATRARANAECRRHQALVGLRGATASRALAARVRVYDDAQPEADKILAGILADLEARRSTTVEWTATRMRVEELRALAAAARRDLAALPPPDPRPLGALLATFRSADGELETGEAKLRTVKAYDLNVRLGADRLLDGPGQSTEYFAVVELGLNLGALWVGRGNARAAAGRRRYVRSGRDPLGSDATVEQLRAIIDVEAKRTDQAVALIADLERQLQLLARLPGEDSERVRQTIWFDWIKAKADLAYLQAHVEALREVLGPDAR